MSKFILLLVALFLSAGIANAQYGNVNTSAGLNAEAGKGQKAQATATVQVRVGDDDDDNSTSTDDDAEDDDGDDNKRGKSATSSSGVSLQAREIRGWSEQEKSQFLLQVKSHVELRNGQDLENFAKGVLVENEDIEEVTADDTKVEVTYKLPAKFLGIFATEIKSVANVKFSSEKTSQTPEEVKVKFPWYRVFYSLDEDTRSDIIQNAIELSLEGSATTTATTSAYARSGKAIQLISSLIKSIRASIEAEANAEVEVSD